MQAAHRLGQRSRCQLRDRRRCGGDERNHPMIARILSEIDEASRFRTHINRFQSWFGRIVAVLDVVVTLFEHGFIKITIAITQLK